MECRDAILSRRSIRKYTDQAVSDEDLNYILEAALNAPSGTNLQPWYFVIIKNEEEKRKIIRLMEGVSDDMEPHLKERFPRHPDVVKTTLSFVRTLGNAPVLVLVFWYRPEYSKTAATIHQSIGAAIQNMLLAAKDRGLGSCWLTAPVETKNGDRLREAYAPEKGELAALITIGHPAEEPPAPKRKDGRYVII